MFKANPNPLSLKVSGSKTTSKHQKQKPKNTTSHLVESYSLMQVHPMLTRLVEELMSSCNMDFALSLSTKFNEIDLTPRAGTHPNDYQNLSKWVRDSWESIPQEDRAGFNLEWHADRPRRKNWDRWELVEEDE